MPRQNGLQSFLDTFYTNILYLIYSNLYSTLGLYSLSAEIGQICVFNREWQCFGKHIAKVFSFNPQLVIQIHESTCGWQLFLPKLPLYFQQNACWQNKKTSWPANGNFLAKCCQTFFIKTADSILLKQSNLPVDLRVATIKLPRLPGCQSC